MDEKSFEKLDNELHVKVNNVSNKNIHVFSILSTSHKVPAIRK